MAAVVSNGVTAAAGVISCLLEALRIIYSSYTLSDLNKQPVKQVNLSRFWFRYAVPLTDPFCSCEGQHKMCFIS